jgi:hypothetical protein
MTNESDRLWNEVQPGRYADREGRPISMREWGEKNEDFKYKVVQQDQVGKYWVSTVWLGLNHAFASKPMYFETMVFLGEGVATDEQDCERYETEAEAKEGHKAMVKKYSK